MNRKLLTLLFATLMVSLTSLGQQDNKSIPQDITFTVFGAPDQNYNQKIPVYGYGVGNMVRSQFILPRGELVRMQYGEIKRVRFATKQKKLDFGSAQFEVYLAEVNQTVFSDNSFYDWENMTLVYTGSLSVYQYSTWGRMDIDFNVQHFTYEGGDLMIGIKQIGAGVGKTTTFYGQSQTGYNTAIYATGSEIYGNYEQFLPTTTLTYVPHSAPSCIRPHDLTLNDYDYGADYAVIDWTQGNGQTAWQLVYSTDALFNPDQATPIDITVHPYTLSGLNPETDYHVYVRANCGDNGYSEWSDKLTFTTTATCVAPLNLQLVSQDGNSVVIGWEGQGSNYTLRYKNNAEVQGEILLSCDFENGWPSGWTTINQDGDAYCWNHDNGGYTSLEGNGSMYSSSYVNVNVGFVQPDDWLVTPMVELGGTVTFYAKGRLHETLPCSEHFAVYVSTSDPVVGCFTQISPEYVTNGDYVLYSVDLSDYQGLGYIAIRHYNSYHKTSLCIDNFMVYSQPATWIEIENISSSPYTLNGLLERSYYEVQVKTVCSADDSSEWSESLYFTTTSNCANYVVDAEHPFYEGFESTVFPPACWTMVANAYNCNWSQKISAAHIGDTYHYGYHNGVCGASSGLYGPVELVMPEIRIQGSHATLSFWFYYDKFDEGGHDYVKISTNNGSHITSLSPDNFSNLTWIHYTLSLDSYVNQDIIIKFRHESNESCIWFLDDIAITVAYDKEFTTAGNWDVASNWTPSGVPTSNQSVLISKAATIPSGCVAEAKSIKIGNGSLTIADGGQLKHNNKGVNAIAKKTITGYGNGTGNWNLIATPVERSHYPTNVTNLIPTNSDDYDLYRFDQNLGIEWRNYKQGEIAYVSNTEGYLYANSTTTNIEFGGELMPSQENVTVALDCSDYQYESTGWNLIGNPFACNAYLQGNPNFYRMNANGDEIVISSGAISPCEGIFVKATEPGQSATFTRTARSGSGNQLDFNLSDAQGQTIDRARIHLNSTQRTDKFSLNPNNTKLYIPNEGNEYAAFGAESSGEIPVNFKSSKDGKYCISVDCDMNMGYLHLIDNLTGADVDLRKTPTYSFTSKTTDYASRFKVVFMAESDGNEDSFAFVNNGKLIVLDSDHEATLQVIDMTGRILSSERISGSCMMPLNYTPGVYVLRLIEGNEVRTQKIVLGRN